MNDHDADPVHGLLGRALESSITRYGGELTFSTARSTRS